MSTKMKRLPPWLTRRWPLREQTAPVVNVLKELGLATVCQEARCPNRGECFARHTATFMILGRVCSRGCTFCAVRGGEPEPVDPSEPQRVAEATARLGLRYVVVTSVTRDDLPDGGSEHFALTIEAIRARCGAAVEVLIPDFQGRRECLERVLAARPIVLNHNIETVPRLYPEVRLQADYRRSLQVLKFAADSDAGVITKSGLMLGLGEREEEVLRCFEDLLKAGCRLLTLGQYLRPSPAHHPVVEFVTPGRFVSLGEKATHMGFERVASGPFVRSSYNARELAEHVRNGDTTEAS